MGADERMGAGGHLVVLPYPARGHNLAALQLARQMAARGARITLGNIFDNLEPEQEEICAADGVAVVSLGVRPSDPGPANLPFLADVEAVQGDAELLLARLGPVTCIISDIFLGWTQSVAEKFGIPRYVLCASPARLLATFLYMPALAARAVVPVQSADAGEFVHIPGLPPTRRGDLSPAVQAASPVYRQFYAQYVDRCCWPAVAAAGFFINSFEELEPACVAALRRFPYSEVSRVPSFFPVGPLVDDAYLRLLRSEGSSGFVAPEAAYLQWLHKQPPDSVLYVNFGSIVSLSLRQIHELALGLEASQQRFLLVVRPSAGEKLPLLPDAFTAHARGTGFVQPAWVNQLDVLSHPAVGGFLTHCGWNSTLESVCRGVPLLAWPFQADQMLNCRFLVDEVRTAVEVCKGPDGFVSRDEVARGARRLMTEPEGEAAKENVRALREKLKAAASEDGSAQRSVEAFLAEIKTRP